MRLVPTKTLQDLKAKYWFLPSGMATFAVALSFLMPWLDERYAIDPSGAFGRIGQTQTDGARAVLVAIAGSIVGVAGTTFSITMVAESFASANFGPRPIANFMRDRGNRLTLGTFISTFVYCLLVLRRVHDSAGDGAGSTLFSEAKLRAAVDAGSLIGGEPVFDEVSVSNANVDLVVDENGKGNWESLLPLPAADDAEGADPASRRSARSI